MEHELTQDGPFHDDTDEELVDFCEEYYQDVCGTQRDDYIEHFEKFRNVWGDEYYLILRERSDISQVPINLHKHIPGKCPDCGMKMMFSDKTEKSFCPACQ